MTTRTIAIDNLEDFIEGAMQRLTLNATSNFIEDTPVDTGWARANWVPNIGQAFNGTAGSREAAESGSVSLSEQQGGIANVTIRYRLQSGPIYISNNVPYITQLNEGTSAQAPAGFVQAGIQRGIRQTLTQL